MLDKIIKRQAQWPLLARIYILYLVLFLFNCLLTANPYTALRGGSFGFDQELFADAFTIRPGILLIAAVFPCLVLHFFSLRPPITALVAITALLLSGLMTKILTERPLTYGYDSLVLLLCATTASYDARDCLKANEKFLDNCGYFLILLQLVGLFVSWQLPYTYGNVPIGISREFRGEIVVWSLTAIGSLVPAFAACRLHKRTTATWFLCFGATLVLAYHVLAYNRAHMAKMVAFVIGVIFFSLRGTTRFFLSLLIGAFFLLLWRQLTLYFNLGQDEFGVMAGIEADRYNLWMTFWDNFLNHRLFGAGLFSLERSNYIGVATSEVGVIKWFGEGGLLYGGSMLFILLRGSWAAFMMLYRRPRSRPGLDLICAYIALTTMPLALITWYSRIIMFDEFLFFYALFYCAERYPQSMLALPRSSSSKLRLSLETTKVPEVNRV